MIVRFAAVLILLAIPATAQEEAEKNRRGDDRIELDFSFDYEPEELREHIMDRLRWKRIWGPIGIAGYHIYPGVESGPYTGPPQTIWTNGWGASLWRDPVTGWPLL